MKLKDIAKVVRSKNAGPFTLTIDLLFPSQEAYETVKFSEVINAEKISTLYDIPKEKVQIIFYPPGLAVKIVMPRRVGSGDIQDTDVYGAQQHTPMLNLEVPEIVKQSQTT
ncbi:MAG: DUF4387 domain-containing protein [Deltaproteobacteria bacterium]|nr:DUF4387 domain-containing protein [Deltaproteobacteria bacterium]MBW1962149.1 DUF4387 domain-containing protein [Deltaproteobacteria bacterium]MBW2150285.1 DUF4387 domain-containing protein [Deltaproteobacteria bacterium]